MKKAKNPTVVWNNDRKAGLFVMRKNYSIGYKEEGEGLSLERRFAYTAASGFAQVSFSLEEGTIHPEALAAARAAGLAAEALYLPMDSLNLLWEPSPSKAPREDVLPSDPTLPDETTWEELLALYTFYFSLAARVGIEQVILPSSCGTNPAHVTQAALARFRTLAELAKEKGVRLLIENGMSAPHFEAVVRVCCEDGYHGVSFMPARAFHCFGTSALPPYAAKHLMRVSLDDVKGEESGYLPLDGSTDFRPFAKSVAPLHFRGTLAVSPNASLAPYRELGYFALASRAYDRMSSVLRLMKNAEGVV